MSIRQSTSASHEYPCERENCSGTFEHGEDVEGSFCSKQCYHTYHGQKLLNTLENDHCTCANCGSVLKTIEKPKPERAFDHTGTGWTLNREENRWELEWYGQEESSKAAVGFQYRTYRADIHEFNTVCGNCGNCTLSKPFPESQSIFLEEYSRGLLDALERKHSDHEKEIDRDEFFQHLETPDDIPLALGRAIDDA